MRTLQKEIEMSVLLAHAIEDSTGIFGISGGRGLKPYNHPRRYVTDRMQARIHHSGLAGGVNGDC